MNEMHRNSFDLIVLAHGERIDHSVAWDARKKLNEKRVRRKDYSIPSVVDELEDSAESSRESHSYQNIVHTV